jgi:uncharacterized protein YxeA
MAGVLAALVSALIEYQVFSELYIKVTNTSGFFKLIPLFLVIAFEVTKVFLIFLNKQYTQRNETSYLKDKNHFLILRTTLIIFSVVATLIFSFYNLHNPEFESQKQSELLKINNKYDKLKKDSDNSFTNQYQNQILPYEDDNKIQQDKINRQENIYKIGTTDYEGQKWNEATNAKKENLKTITNIYANVEKERREKNGSIETERSKEINKIESSLQTSTKSNNKMLGATLQIFNGTVEFPQTQYLLLIGILSLLLSVGLEYIIWSSFTILSINHGEIFDFGIMTEKYKNATDAEIEMNKADANKETQTLSNMARAAVSGVREKMNDLFNRGKNEIRKNK